MMKRTLRIALAPFMLTVRLLLGLAAFVTSIASSVLGLTVGLFVLRESWNSPLATGRTVSPLWPWRFWRVP